MCASLCALLLCVSVHSSPGAHTHQCPLALCRATIACVAFLTVVPALFFLSVRAESQSQTTVAVTTHQYNHMAFTRSVVAATMIAFALLALCSLLFMHALTPRQVRPSLCGGLCCRLSLSHTLTLDPWFNAYFLGSVLQRPSGRTRQHSPSVSQPPKSMERGHKKRARKRSASLSACVFHKHPFPHWCRPSLSRSTRRHPHQQPRASSPALGPRGTRASHSPCSTTASSGSGARTAE